MPERRVLEIAPLVRRLDGSDMAVGLGGLQPAARRVARVLSGTAGAPADINEAIVPERSAQAQWNVTASARILPGEHWHGGDAVLGTATFRPVSGAHGFGSIPRSSAGFGSDRSAAVAAPFQLLAIGNTASTIAPLPLLAPPGIPDIPVPLAETGIRAPDIVSVNAGQAANMPSPTQRIDFTSKEAAPITTLGSLSYNLPGAFYQSFSKSLSYGADGFGAYANVALAGGIKGGFTLSFGSIVPNYPLMLNAETVGSVADGKVFTVMPTLISTDDAFFKLGLPTADVHATYGLKLHGGVGLSFPSVSIGIGPFSYSFGPPPLYESIVDINDIQTLATSKTENFNGGYATVSELTGGTYTSTTTYQKYGLPTITETAYTEPFLKAGFDPLAALGAYIPELKALDGSEDFGVGHASWSLLSLPIDASLEIANKITLTETGFNVTLSERVGGTTKSLGTHPVTIGTSQGYQWNLTAPTKGAGVINFTLDYALTLSVQSEISLFGSFGMTLDGPQASLDILGHSLDVSPLFSIPLVSESGDLFTYDLPSTVETLTAVQHDQVFYGPIAAEQNLVSNLYMHYEMKAGGERFKIASGVVIAPATNTVGPTIGVEGTLGAAAVYNYGSIYPSAPNQSVLDSSIGISLPGGGKVVNAGNIDYGRSGQFFQGGLRYGIEIGGYGSTVVNSGNIVGDVWAGIDIAGTAASAAYVLNSQTGTLLATGFYGILAKGSELEVNNEGKIQLGGGRFGVYGQTGLFLDNSGFITASDQSGGSHSVGSADVYSGGKSASYVNNDGAIGIYTGANAGQAALALVGVYLGDGIVVNSGTIAGAEFGVYVGRYGSAVVDNAGLIEATGNTRFVEAVRMLGGTNELMLDPGARFAGGVYASSQAGANNNSIVLNPGSVAGTLNMTGGARYTGFGEIDVFPAASWVLETTQNVDFYGATITGLTSEDLIKIQGLSYSAGESISLATSTDILTLQSSNGSILEQVRLGGNLAGADFHVRGNNGNTYIREFNGNFTDVITGAIGAQTINANSYYGGRLTVASGATVSYNAQGGSSAYGLDLQAVTSTSKSTIGGTTKVTSAVSAAALTNFGTITGNKQGVFLQSPGGIYNKAGAQISGQTYGIEEKADYAGVFIGNSGSISGGETGIYLAGGSTIVNLGSVYGAGTGLTTKNAAAIYNSGTIRGAQGEGISMVAGAVTNVAGGVISSAGIGIGATGKAVNVTNSGTISGSIGIVLSAGGGVTNTYAAGGGGTDLVGTITGTSYAVEVSGGAGEIVNEANGLARMADPGIIEGVSLAAGGLVTNGEDGEIISPHGAYAINLGSGGAATVVNNGIIGSIFAGGPDQIINGLAGTIQSVVGASGAPVTIQNHGTIGNATIATGLSESGKAAIYNVGGAGTLATIEGHTGIILSASGLIDNSAGGLIEGLAGSGIRLLAGGSIINAGQITASGSGAAITMNGGTLTDLGLISGTNGAAALAFGATAATVVIDPGAVFTGAVTGNGSNDVLDLGGTTAGTLSGIGTEITGFKTNAVLAGSDWFLAGTNTLAGNWSVSGILLSGQASSGIYDGIVVTGNVNISGRMEGENAARGATGGGATGVDLQSGKINNAGGISGGYGALGGYSGDGAVIGGGTLVNSGAVKGGSYSFAAGSGAGGNGVDLAGGVLTNSGLILGGATGSFYGTYGPGGAGVLLSGPGVATNTGTITGGAGAYQGGKGAIVAAGALTNSRQITGGYGRTDGGAGAYVNGGTLMNAGTLTGGGASVSAGFGAVVVAGTLVNSGVILPGKAGSGAGIGAELMGGTLINAGTISGTNGGAAVQFGTAVASLQLDPGAVFVGNVIANSLAGDALDLAGSGHGTLAGLGGQFTGFAALEETAGATWTIAGKNSFAGPVTASGLLTIGGTLNATGSWTVAGTVDVTGSLSTAGVIAGASGLAALGLQSGVLVNSGTLAGGGGHYDFSTDTGENGGAGLAQTGGSGVNTGLIAGGNGVVSSGGLPGYVGGVGVSLSAGTLTNAGRIQGGAGDYSDNGGGSGGAGVSLLSGTLVNTGTIQGGAGGYGDATYSIAAGSGGAGVYLGGGTLVTSGAIAGGAGGVLLGGSQNGAAGDAVGFGAKAATLILKPGATFGGAVAANSAVNDVLELSGTTAATLSGLGTQFSGFSSLLETTGAQWTLSGQNSFAGALTIDGALTDAGTLAISGVVSGPGTLVVAAGGTVSGTGTISVPLIDHGLVEAAGGILVESGAVSGTGTLAAEAGATLDIARSGTLGGTLAGAGTIALTVAGTLASGAVLSAGTFLQEATLTLATGESLTPGGKTYVVETSGASGTTALSGSSANLFTNKATLLEKGAGTSEFLVSLKNTGVVDSTAGTFSLLGTVTNTGTLSALGGTLVAAQTVGGAGTLDVGKASLLWLKDGAAAGQTVNFVTAGGTLDLGAPATFAGHILDFGASDVIELAATAATKLSYNAGVLSVDKGTTTVASIHFNGSYTTASFSLTADTHGNSIISFA
jgi:hypothetical protein